MTETTASLDIWVFESIHRVLALEGHIRAASIWYDLIPTPTHISTDCGVVLATRPTDREIIQELLQRHRAILGHVWWIWV